jgi:hypothetical protein
MNGYKQLHTARLDYVHYSYVNTKGVVYHVQQNAWSMYIYNTHKATDKVVCTIHDDPL